MWLSTPRRYVNYKGKTAKGLPACAAHKIRQHFFLPLCYYSISTAARLAALRYTMQQKLFMNSPISAHAVVTTQDCSDWELFDRTFLYRKPISLDSCRKGRSCSKASGLWLKHWWKTRALPLKMKCHFGCSFKIRFIRFTCITKTVASEKCSPKGSETADTMWRAENKEMQLTHLSQGHGTSWFS